MRAVSLWLVAALLAVCSAVDRVEAQFVDLEPLRYRTPQTPVDLGVGLWAWPLPIDFDRDGDYDLLVSCPDKPFRGLYFFENASGRNSPMPVFRAPRRIGDGLDNVSVSRHAGQPRIWTPGQFRSLIAGIGLAQPTKVRVPANVHGSKVRANQWCEVDFDGDGDLDLVIGVGDWADYGWDNAYAADGEWQHGPLHGYVYLVENQGTAEKPAYAAARKLEAAGKPIDVFGRPSPNVSDFDGDGDLDLLCGEFRDGMTYFPNTGTRQQPRFGAGIALRDSQGKPLRMDLQMIVPSAVDWDRDGDVDLIVGDEDGRVAWCEHTGDVREGAPVFRAPLYLRQEPDLLKFGALATPFAVDWDGDGDTDVLAGNSAGCVAYFENLDGGDPPSFAPPVLVRTAGEVLRIMAGPNGSIQGPAESKWGYTTLSVADWDGDGRLDLLLNSILGRVVWYRNVGARGAPRLDRPRAVQVAWPGQAPYPKWNWWRPGQAELVTQWRTTPFAVDWNSDGLCDLVMLDHEGYLALFRRTERAGRRVLTPGERIFLDDAGQPLRLAVGEAGRSGRRKFTIVDWDGDGVQDLLINSRNVDWMRGLETTPEGGLRLAAPRPLSQRVLAGHTTSPTVVDWNRDGRPDLVVGAEDGHFYYMRRIHSK